MSWVVERKEKKKKKGRKKSKVTGELQVSAW
jgi:hypothetical protein